MKNDIFSFRFYLVVFLFSPVFFGCGLLGKHQRVKSYSKKTQAKKTELKDEQTWEQIKQKTKKPLAQRIKDIEAFIRANEDKEIALDAYLLKAKILLKNKRNGQACLSYHKIVQSSFDYTRRWEVYRASAKCQVQEGKLNSALETLERLIQNPKENTANKKAGAKLQWNFIKNKKTFFHWKLISLSHLSILSSQVKEQQAWKSRGEQLIHDLPSNDLIVYADQASLYGIFEGYLLYKTARYFFENKKLSRSKYYFEKSLSSPLSLDLKKKAKNSLLLIRKITKVNPYLIGVLIPLSGRRQILGEKVLRGLYMGLGMDKDSSWQIIVVDSKSHSDVVRMQLDNLFYKHNIIGLVGGLTGETAEVIAEKAEAFATPAVLFSQKKDLSLNRQFVFQNAITAEQLLQPLVQEVITKLKIKKTAILYPDDPYGRKYSALFSEMFKETGGEIEGYESYKAGEVDFKRHIKNLLQLNIKGREKEFEKLKQKFLEENPFLSGRSRKLTPENLLSSKMEFSALFIPDSLDQMHKIKDHLRYFGVKDIYLLGTDLWRPSQISYWPEDLPLIFVNLLKKDQHLVKNSLFYKNFMNSYAQPPGLFEQRAYNSALFLKQALDQGARTRLSLQRELKKIKTLQGAYYKVSISKDQVFNYPLSIYKMGVGKARNLDSVPVK